MKKELQNKLSRYTAAAAAVVAATSATAQITYTDVNPDYSVDDDQDANGFTAVALDLNNDATPDFILASRDTVTASHVRFTLVAPYGSAGNAIAGENPGGYDYALALNLNDMIDNSLNWIATTNTMAYNVDSSNPYNENWNGVTDKYLGLKFIVGANTHYGWARLDVQAIGDVWTLKDYAYNATPDGAIMAGQVAGINTMELESLLHFVNQADNSVKVVINGDLTEGKISLISAAGQVVSTGNVDSNEYNVSLNGLSAGIYVISAEFAEGTMTKKVIVH